MTAERYPLTWPVGLPRARYRTPARFEVDFARARDELVHSIELLGGKRLILSSNVPTRNDGLPYSNMAEPKDPGVAVYFDRMVKDHWRPFVLACDTYAKVRWNVRAIGATVEALRAIQRHGAGSLLEQAFTGFAALPPPATQKQWWDVLGVSASASADEVRARMHELAKIHHPDLDGGDGARMVEINQAYSEALRAVG